MGDRCYMNMRFGGHIETVEQMTQIVDAIAADWGRPNADYGEISADKVVQYIVECAAAGEKAAYFDFEEVNYGQLDCTGLIADLGFDVYATNEAGCEYPAGSQSWNGQTGEKFEWTECEADNIEAFKIKAVLNADSSDSDKIAAIRALIAETEAQQWVALRPLTVSEAVLKRYQEGPPPPAGTAHAVALMARD